MMANYGPLSRLVVARLHLQLLLLLTNVDASGITFLHILVGSVVDAFWNRRCVFSRFD